MNKLFWVLVFLCFMGAFALWSLLGVLEPSHKGTIPKSDVRAQAEDIEEIYSEGPAEVSSKDSTVDVPYLKLLTQPMGAQVYIEGSFYGKTPLRIEIKNQTQDLRLSHPGYIDYSREVPSKEQVSGELVWKIQLHESMGSVAESSKDLKKKEKAKLVKKKNAEKKTSLNSDAKEDSVAKIVKKALNEDASSSKFLPLAPSNNSSLESNKDIQKELSIEERIPRRTGNLKGSFIQVRSLEESSWEAEASLAWREWTLSDQKPFRCLVNISGKGRWYRIFLGPYSLTGAKRVLSQNKNKLPQDAWIVGAQKCL